MSKRSLSTGRVAKCCDVGQRTVLRWIASGRLPAYQLPGRGDNRVLIEDCVKFMQENGLPVPAELADAVSPPRVMIIEDDQRLVNFLQRLFERDGYQVEAADDGLHAGAVLNRFRPHLIILDLELIRVGGLEVLKYVRSTPELQGTKVLVVSGLAAEALAEARAAGADAIMAKPCPPSEVKAQVDRMLGFSE